MPLSDMVHMSMWVDSGASAAKSQNVSCAVWAWGISRSGSGLAAWIRSGNLIPSWMKNTGMFVADQVPVPLARVEPDCEPAHIPGGVSRASRAGHRREADEH